MGLAEPGIPPFYIPLKYPPFLKELLKKNLSFPRYFILKADKKNESFGRRSGVVLI